MLKVFEISVGVCGGMILTFFILWLTGLVVQYLSGERYFTPSKHIIVKKFAEKKGNISDEDRIFQSN